MKIIAAILILSIIGTLIVGMFESAFGVENIFVFATVIVSICGLALPIVQHSNNKK